MWAVVLDVFAKRYTRVDALRAQAAKVEALLAGRIARNRADALERRAAKRARTAEPGPSTQTA